MVYVYVLLGLVVVLGFVAYFSKNVKSKEKTAEVKNFIRGTNFNVDDHLVPDEATKIALAVEPKVKSVVKKTAKKSTAKKTPKKNTKKVAEPKVLETL